MTTQRESSSMSDGGHTMTEGWNLQLQGKIARLEADLAEAEKHLWALHYAGRSVEPWKLAWKFLKRLEEERRRAAEQAAEIEALLASEQESPADERDGRGSPSAGA